MGVISCQSLCCHDVWCPTHDDNKMTDKICHACFPQGQDLTELVSQQDPCPLRISHVSECMVSSNCKHSPSSLAFFIIRHDENRISCCQCKRMLCESVKVTVSFSYATYPHSCHQTCHQTTRVANRRRCPFDMLVWFLCTLAMRGQEGTALVFWLCSLLFEFYTASWYTRSLKVFLYYEKYRFGR
jgi:hypothetical protein